MEKRYSFPREKMKILLLEGVHQACTDRFSQSGYQPEIMKSALSEEELLRVISGVHVLGIRSKTQVTAKVLDAAESLLAIGCFCIGTDQVDLAAAAARGVPVYNAPFSNTRSVAELAMAEMVMLARRAAHKSQLLHRGVWEKSAEGCMEVRNKTVGLIGYGHIGPQVGLLAESFGMRVYYYDIVGKLPFGNAAPVASLDELLKVSDFVSLHVPETADTRNLIGESELRLMKKGAFLLNLSRGKVVDLDAVRASLQEGSLGGAAIDVFPEEPASNDDPFSTPLMGLDNVILTPHIGGSTIEAQRNIGIEVATTLLKFIEVGSTTGSVNFPQVELPVVRDSHRILNIHQNVPGVLSSINTIIAQMGGNIQAQYLNTLGEVGYLIIDVDQQMSQAVKSRIDDLPTSIKTRLLF
ncbi:MAG: phosphoglycerate dehydrogenase [Pseudomonadota bacterium]|jgi:D-3-phosphoglycerate dehydrogenase